MYLAVVSFQRYDSCALNSLNFQVPTEHLNREPESPSSDLRTPTTRISWCRWRRIAAPCRTPDRLPGTCHASQVSSSQRGQSGGERMRVATVPQEEPPHDSAGDPLSRLEDPYWHPEGRADEESVTAPTEQGHLEERRLDVLFHAIAKISEGVSQVVFVKAVFDLLGLSPDMEDKVFFDGRLCPESMPGILLFFIFSFHV